MIFLIIRVTSFSSLQAFRRIEFGLTAKRLGAAVDLGFHVVLDRQFLFSAPGGRESPGVGLAHLGLDVFDLLIAKQRAEVGCEQPILLVLGIAHVKDRLIIRI